MTANIVLNQYCCCMADVQHQQHDFVLTYIPKMMHTDLRNAQTKNSQNTGLLCFFNIAANMAAAWPLCGIQILLLLMTQRCCTPNFAMIGLKPWPCIENKQKDQQTQVFRRDTVLFRVLNMPANITTVRHWQPDFPFTYVPKFLAISSSIWLPGRQAASMIQ